MTSPINVVTEDLRAAKLAFEARDYAQANIFANRLMGNVIYGAPKSFALIGFILKDIAVDCLRIRKKTDSISKLEPHITECISALYSAVDDDEVDAKKAWEAFHTFVSASRPEFQTEIERKTYKEATGFTHGAIYHLVTKNVAPEGALVGENLMIIKGVLHESVRLMRTHGISLKDLGLYGALVSFDRVYDYAILAASTSQEVDKKRLAFSIEPQSKRLLEVFQKHQKNEDWLNPTTDFVCDLTIEWREYFTRYLEPTIASGKENKRVALPDEFKQKIAKAVGKEDSGQKKAGL